MLEELQRLLRPMDLPCFRKTGTTHENLRWLKKNLAVRNATHKNYQSAMEILNTLVRK